LPCVIQGTQFVPTLDETKRCPTLKQVRNHRRNLEIKESSSLFKQVRNHRRNLEIKEFPSLFKQVRNHRRNLEIKESPSLFKDFHDLGQIFLVLVLELDIAFRFVLEVRQMQWLEVRQMQWQETD
jgi:hypothetical protein